MRMIEGAELRSAVCVSKAARGDGCERFVNSAKQSPALMFAKVTQAAAGWTRTHGHILARTQVHMHTCTPAQEVALITGRKDAA